MGWRKSLKGDLAKQQKLVRAADNILGFGFSWAVHKNKAPGVESLGWWFKKCLFVLNCPIQALVAGLKSHRVQLKIFQELRLFKGNSS